MCNLDRMTFEELAQLKAQLDSHISEYKPFTIKEVWRKCGKASCRCSEPFDPSEFEDKQEYQELNLHGPYLFASWRDNGKTKTLSLGRKHSYDEITALQAKPAPNWFDKPFILSEKQYENLAQELQWSCYERTLSERDYVAKYGVSRELELGDRLQRKVTFKFNAPKFERVMDSYKESQKVAYSKWTRYGVGSYKALGKLKALEADKFYFKPE